MVHKKDQLSNSQKYNFLITSPSENPLSLVKTLHLTDDNYPLALKTLNESYQNKSSSIDLLKILHGQSENCTSYFEITR